MASFADIIKQWATADGAADPEIKILDDEGDRVQYAFRADIDGEDIHAWFDASEKSELLGLTLYAPGDVPPGRRAAVAELANWINDGAMEIGNFEVSAERGYVRFRANMMAPAERFAPDMLDKLIDTGTSAMEHFLHAIRAVAFAGMAPRAAARMCMGDDEDFTPEKVSAGGTAPWSSFFGSGALQAWTAEVRAALADGADEEAWRMASHAIVVEHDYSGIGVDLARRLAADCGLPLGVFGGDDLASLPDASVLERAAPLMLYIEPGAWQKRIDKDAPDEAAQTARSRLQDLLRAFNPARPVICMTIVESISDMAFPLRHSGLFDRWFNLPTPSHALAGEALLDMVDRDRCAPSLIGAAAKAGKLLSYRYESPERRRLMSLGLRRLHAKAGRPLEFLDLVELEVQGLVEAERPEENPDDVRRYIACHEAGHAAMAYLDSAGHDIPEYSSIVPHGDGDGVVVDSISYAFAHEGRHTFLDFRHEIRTFLAGRAAEELCFGAGGISRGASLDLEMCTRRASTAFALWGFTPDMDEAEATSGNLAVIVGKPSSSEEAHVEQLVRRFLDREYRVVLSMLAAHRPLLDAIVERLQACAVLDQAELAEICRDVVQTVA